MHWDGAGQRLVVDADRGGRLRGSSCVRVLFRVLNLTFGTAALGGCITRKEASRAVSWRWRGLQPDRASRAAFHIR
jgi:hypothetical protein